MYNEVEGLNATRESATLAGQWLTQMATAAGKIGATVQYCMSLGRLVTMAAELPSLTQFRAGDDYGPGQPAGCSYPYCVYYIGTTSLLGWALALAPSKDIFWSTEFQPGSPFGHGNATEPYSAMEAAVAVFSTAPVMLADGVGFTNVTLALATCTSGGRLLQPSRPASATDAAFAAAALGAGSGGPQAAKQNNLPVMSSFTAVAQPVARQWAHVLVIGLAGASAVVPADLPLDLAPAADELGFIAYDGWRERGGGAFSNVRPFSAAAPIALAAAPDAHDWSLTHVAPVMANGWALLGEAAKLCPVAVARVDSVDVPPAGGLRVHVTGEPGERVELSFADPGLAVLTSACVLPASGQAYILRDGSGGSCA